MRTAETLVSNGDQNDYVKEGLDALAKAANEGVGPGEKVQHEVGHYPFLGHSALQRSNVVYNGKIGSDYYLG